MRAIDLSRKAPLVRPTDKLADAAKALLGGDCVVVAEGDDVLGVIADADIVEAVARGVGADSPAIEAVNSPPLFVEGHEPLWRVAEAMLNARAEVAVVTLGGKLAGVLTSRDIADESGQLLEASEFAEMAERLAPPG